MALHHLETFITKKHEELIEKAHTKTRRGEHFNENEMTQLVAVGKIMLVLNGNPGIINDFLCDKVMEEIGVTYRAELLEADMRAVAQLSLYAEALVALMREENKPPRA